MSRLNPNSFDGPTGEESYDFVAQNGLHGAHGAEMRDIRRFSDFSNDQNCLKYRSSGHQICQNCVISCAGAQYSKRICVSVCVCVCVRVCVRVYVARRAGVPFGEARRVILRGLKFRLKWKPKNRFTHVNAIQRIWIRLARISILIERRRIYDS